jgi:hypothetical protein
LPVLFWADASSESSGNPVKQPSRPDDFSAYGSAPLAEKPVS